MLNFYSSFLPNISTILKPLRAVTEKNVLYKWTDQCERSFLESKKSLLCSNLLVNYDPTKEMIVHVDASPVGLGCVLNHVCVDAYGRRSERPVLFASCSLTPRQQRYSQLDREAMAIIFAVTELRKYLWGQRFTLVTDNAPISPIFSPDKSLPVLAHHRIQYWATILAAFDYKLLHKKADKLKVADALSRLPSNCFMVDVHFEDLSIFPEFLPGPGICV